MKKELTLADQLNKRKWWHSPPTDKVAYKKRGMFLSSSYKECEFYGRPLNKLIRVNVSKPILDTEQNIIRFFFGNDSRQMRTFDALINGTAKCPLNARFKLDADLFRAAKKNKYDAIAIVTEKGLEEVNNRKLSRSVELNVIDIKNGIDKR